MYSFKHIILLSRVKLFIHFTNFFGRYLCIYLSGTDIRMAEHLLDCPQVGSVFNQMGSERMPESVRCDIFPDTAQQFIFFYGFPQPLPDESPASSVSDAKIIGVFCFKQLRSDLGHIMIEFFCDEICNGHYSFLAAFTADLDESHFRIDVRPLNIAELTHTYT